MMVHALYAESTTIRIRLALRFAQTVGQRWKEVLIMTNWISVKDHLPDDGQTVRIWAGGEHIATFRKGISEEDRRRMKSHEIDDPIVWVWRESTGLNAIARSDQYYSKDVFGNNLVPYNWEGDGCMVWKGQDVTHWAQTSEPPKENDHEIVIRGDVIRSMTDEELAHFLSQWGTATRGWQKDPGETLYWLLQPEKEDEEEDHGNQTDI